MNYASVLIIDYSHTAMALFLVSAALLGAALQGTQQLGASRSDARRSRFRNAVGPTIITASSQASLLAGVVNYVGEDDTILEIGCQLGELTSLLSERANACYGIDVMRELQGKSGRGGCLYRSHSTAEEAGLPSVHFSLVDPWDVRALQEALAEASPTVAVIDVNQIVGNDLPLEALALTRTVGRCFPSLRHVLIKSRMLDRLQRQLTPLPRLLSEREGDASFVPPPSWLPRIVTTRGVSDYRRAALELVGRLRARGESGVRALEIGCHFGTSTALVHDALAAQCAGACAGVDVSRSVVERARPPPTRVVWSVRRVGCSHARGAAGTRRRAARHRPARRRWRIERARPTRRPCTCPAPRRHLWAADACDRRQVALPRRHRARPRACAPAEGGTVADGAARRGSWGSERGG